MKAAREGMARARRRERERSSNVGALPGLLSGFRSLLGSASASREASGAVHRPKLEPARSPRDTPARDAVKHGGAEPGAPWDRSPRLERRPPGSDAAGPERRGRSGPRALPTTTTDCPSDAPRCPRSANADPGWLQAHVDTVMSQGRYACATMKAMDPKRRRVTIGRLLPIEAARLDSGHADLFVACALDRRTFGAPGIRASHVRRPRRDCGLSGGAGRDGMAPGGRGRRRRRGRPADRRPARVPDDSSAPEPAGTARGAAPPSRAGSEARTSPVVLAA